MSAGCGEEDALPDKHGEIVDTICRMAGITERIQQGSPTLSKKEALQVAQYLTVLLQTGGPRHAANRT